MSNKQKTANEMLNYLEQKYGGPFEAEEFEKGSTLFPEMYGGDKMIVHPANNRDIPFYVFKKVKSEGYSDDYVLSFFSYKFTEKHKHEIETLTDREIAVKYALGFSDRPGADVVTTPTDEFVNDQKYSGSIYLYVAVKMPNGQKMQNDSAFLYSLYKHMKQKTDRNFIISVAYIKQDRFSDAQDAIRIAHAINFSWTLIEDGVMSTEYIESEENITDSSYFDR